MDRPAPCTSPSGLECTNPDHEHRNGSKELTCDDCGVPLFYDTPTDAYWHTDPNAAPCLFIPDARS